MTQTQALTKTLVFPLDVQSGNESLLHDARLECRRVFNEVLRLNYDGWDWNEIEDVVEQNADLVQNTAQCVIDKAFDALDNYYDYDDYDDWGRPWYKHETFPLRMNYTEGYNLFLQDDNRVRFRISAKPYNHIKGELRGTQDQFDLLTQAMKDDDWHVGTAEALVRHGREELHVIVTNETAAVGTKTAAETVVGVDINEDCVALAALTESGIEDSVVIDYPEIKEQRHRYFTMRKRMQEAEQTAFNNVFHDKEQRFVHDQLHTVSRRVVEWIQRFDSPVIVFEDLTDMRDDIEYGTRMNRRLHSLPFAKLRKFITYKAAWHGILSDDVDPEYTSQQCPLCGHTERANRNKKRFKCRECEHQDHADRGAGVSVAQKWLRNQDNRTVPALNTLPQVRKWELRRQASGPVNGPTVASDTVRGNQSDGIRGVSD
jgi:IS605 OrfB family transposase